MAPGPDQPILPPVEELCGSLNRRRLLQAVVLVAGLAGLAVAVATTLDDANDQVLPGPGALAVSASLALIAIVMSGRAWAALFHDLLNEPASFMRLRGTFYISQLTKYLPVGGVLQAASQLSLARSTGLPIGRVALAFPVSAVSSVAAGSTLGAGLVLVTDLSGWTRALALIGVATPALLHRRLLTVVLRLVRRVIRRIPNPDWLPSQREILAAYGWALIGIGAFSAAYALLLRSVADGTNPASVFAAYAAGWVIGFLVVPVPAGVGVREAVLIALIPGVGAAPLLAASLALRLLSVITELVAILGNRVAARRHAAPKPRGASTADLTLR